MFLDISCDMDVGNNDDFIVVPVSNGNILPQLGQELGLFRMNIREGIKQKRAHMTFEPAC